MSRNIILGKVGEEYASEYLIKRGYKIIKKNLITPFSEVDIVAVDSDTLVFVEVKTRTNKRFGHPLESVGKRKIDRLKKAIKYYSKVRVDLPKVLRVELLSLIIIRKRIVETRLEKLSY